MVIGVGTDILSMQRMRDTLEGDRGSFVKRVYTAREQEESVLRPDPAVYFATRFAGKEAVFKCFGIDGNIRLNEIEILGSETEQPRVVLLGRVREIAERKGVRDVQISLAYETDYAVAFAVAQD